MEPKKHSLSSVADINFKFYTRLVDGSLRSFRLGRLNRNSIQVFQKNVSGKLFEVEYIITGVSISISNIRASIKHKYIRTLRRRY